MSCHGAWQPVCRAAGRVGVLRRLQRLDVRWAGGWQYLLLLAAEQGVWGFASIVAMRDKRHSPRCEPAARRSGELHTLPNVPRIRVRAPRRARVGVGVRN